MLYLILFKAFKHGRLTKFRAVGINNDNKVYHLIYAGCCYIGFSNSFSSSSMVELYTLIE